MTTYLNHQDFAGIRQHLIGAADSANAYSEAVITVLPQDSLGIRAMGSLIGNIENYALGRWHRIDERYKSGKGTRGYKQISGVENLASIPDDSSRIFFGPHVSEGDYAEGALFLHAGLSHPHIVAGENLTSSKSVIGGAVMTSIFDSKGILTVHRTVSRTGAKAIQAVLGSVLDLNTNVLVFPGATRDRTNSAIGDLGEPGVYRVMLQAAQSTEKETYIVPVCLTWDKIFRPWDKVDQLVTGYAMQNSFDMFKLIVPLIRYMFDASAFLHFGQPMPLSKYQGVPKKVAPDIKRDINSGLMDGVYATPMSLTAVALKDAYGLEGTVRGLADSINAEMDVLGVEKVMDDHGNVRRMVGHAGIRRVAVHLLGGPVVEYGAVLDSLEDVLAQSREKGVRMAPHLQTASAQDVFQQAYRESHVSNLVQSPPQTVHSPLRLSDPLLLFYYAGTLDARLAC